MSSAESSHSVHRLDAVSPLDGRYGSTTEVLAPYFSEGALIRARVEVEARYLIALSHAGLVRPLRNDEETHLMQLAPSLTHPQLERIQEIEAITRHDVKAVEWGIGGFLAGTSLEDITGMIHFALTSEDVNNLAYRLLIQRAREEVFLPHMSEVVDTLAQQADAYKAVPMLARTHGQDAVPTTVGKELVIYAVRLEKEIAKLRSVRLTGKLNGAVGNMNAGAFAATEVDWITFADQFIQSLGLQPNRSTTQINTPEDLIELAHAFIRVQGVYVDLSQDMWRYISDGWFVQRAITGEVGSSTMPQKVNPIDFENAEGNAKRGIRNLEGTADNLATSRLQRDLSGSTIMRYFGSDLTHALLASRSLVTGLGRVSPNVQTIEERLNSNWAILTEAAQTLLRRRGIADAYSLIANLARGEQIQASEWEAWVNALPIDDDTRGLLLALTPSTYLGNAIQLTELGLQEITALRA